MEVGEEKEVYELVVRVFQEHVAPVYSKSGCEKFLGMISPEGLSEMANGNDSFVILAKNEERPIGMPAVRDESHIALFFVDSRYQGEGIGKHLIDEAKKLCLEKTPSLTAVTVSSSPNSVSFYQAVGFKALGDEVDEDGMRFLPMQKTIKFKSRR
jgi:GNAT superfamily N-acetyltransferase